MVYVDTEGSFRAQRLWQVAEARGATNSEELLPVSYTHLTLPTKA